MGISNGVNQKLIVILGPTASGKSSLAIKIAKKFNGEIISADSRQVYKGMDIGTGKVKKKEMLGIPHYLLDVANPRRRFTIVQYRELALKAIDKIFQKGKIPILCGGTGFYIQAVVDGIIIPQVAPDWKLREELERESIKELFKLLRRLDPRRAKKIDKNNPRRLIRAIEIILKTKKPIPILEKNPLPYPVLMIGLKKSPEELKRLIKKRLLKKLKPRSRTSSLRGRQGMIEEVARLHRNGVSWQRLEEFGLEYRHVAKYLQTKLDYKEMVESIQKESENYAKRQITWFKRDKRIKWIKNIKEAEKLVNKFLGN